MNEEKYLDIDQLMYRELSPDRYCYIHNYIIDLKYQLQQKENIIKELNEDKSKMFETAVKRNNQLLDRIERLNNIINELEIEANKNIQVCNNRGFNLISNIDEVKTLDDFTFNEYIGYLVSLEILEKLNELKGE